jgi:hypothetical protein
MSEPEPEAMTVGQLRTYLLSRDKDELVNALVAQSRDNRAMRGALIRLRGVLFAAGAPDAKRVQKGRAILIDAGIAVRVRRP